MGNEYSHINQVTRASMPSADAVQTDVQQTQLRSSHPAVHYAASNFDQLSAIR